MHDSPITYGDDIRSSVEPAPGNEIKPKFPRQAIQACPELEGPGVWVVHPRPGMRLFLFDCLLSKDVVLNGSGNGDAVNFATILPGKSGGQPPRQLNTKSCDMVFKPRSGPNETSLKAGRHCMVSIRIQEDRFREQAQGDPQFDHLLRSLDRGRDVHIISLRPSSPETQMIASQILGCGLRGLCRNLFLEGKSLELIAAILGGLARDHQRAAVPLSRGDMDRLHEARRVLFEHMIDPPGLLELGRMVGLNEFKLKHGFRQVFGCTAFAALREHRLHVARTMLQDSDISVTDVSTAVGYSNMGHFIARFRARFGVTPGSLLRHARRSGQS